MCNLLLSLSSVLQLKFFFVCSDLSPPLLFSTFYSIHSPLLAAFFAIVAVLRPQSVAAAAAVVVAIRRRCPSPSLYTPLTECHCHWSCWSRREKEKSKSEISLFQPWRWWAPAAVPAEHIVCTDTDRLSTLNIYCNTYCKRRNSSWKPRRQRRRSRRSSRHTKWSSSSAAASTTSHLPAKILNSTTADGKLN